MSNERLRHTGGWLLTVALELGATLMALQAAWLTVAMLFFAGIGTLAAAYFPGWGHKSKMFALAGMVFFGVGFIGCTAWYFWPSSKLTTAVTSLPLPDKRWTWDALTDSEMDQLFQKLQGKGQLSVYIACDRHECSDLAASFQKLFSLLSWPSHMGEGGILATGVSGILINPDDAGARLLKQAVETTTVLRPQLGGVRRTGDSNPIMLVIGTKPAEMPSGPLLASTVPRAVMNDVPGDIGEKRGDVNAQETSAILVRQIFGPGPDFSIRVSIKSLARAKDIAILGRFSRLIGTLYGMHWERSETVRVDTRSDVFPGENWTKEIISRPLDGVDGPIIFGIKAPIYDEEAYLFAVELDLVVEGRIMSRNLRGYKFMTANGKRLSDTYDAGAVTSIDDLN